MIFFGMSPNVCLFSPPRPADQESPQPCDEEDDSSDLRQDQI